MYLLSMRISDTVSFRNTKQVTLWGFFFIITEAITFWGQLRNQGDYGIKGIALT